MWKENKKDTTDYNNHSYHLLSTYYVPLVYSVRQVLFPFSPLLFWTKKLKPSKLIMSSGVTQLENGRAYGKQISLSSKANSFHPCREKSSHKIPMW